MKIMWCDTETTGVIVGKSAVFQVGFIFVSNVNGAKQEQEKCFMLNPFDIPGIEYSEEAGAVNGYSRKAIEELEDSKIVVPKIAEYLEECLNYQEIDRMFFAGYNGKFDYEMLEWIFNFYGLDWNRYFCYQKLDVFEQVKNAGRKRVLPYLPNRKLATIAKYLKIDLENAHDALADIRATREVAKSLAKCGIPLR